MTRVIAVERGHDGRFMREPGEAFDVDLKDPKFKGSTWFVTADKAESKPPKTADASARPPGVGPVPGSAVQPEPADGGGDALA